jgi:hypothetical protein
MTTRNEDADHARLAWCAEKRWYMLNYPMLWRQHVAPEHLTWAEWGIAAGLFLREPGERLTISPGPRVPPE